MNTTIPKNLGLDLVRTTEAAALSAGRWIGLGRPVEADRKATATMVDALSQIDIDGVVPIGLEGRRGAATGLCSGQRVGSGRGAQVDLIYDPIDGDNLLAQGYPGAISVVAAAPRGAMWAPVVAAYMSKLIVGADVASALVPECLAAPAAWTLALVARVRQKPVRDLVIFMLDRPRHADLMAEIRAVGAHVMLRSDGDVAGALMAATPGSGVDLLMGIGGIAEGVLATCAVKALGGAILGRLAPQSEAELAAVRAAGYDLRRVLTGDDLVTTDEVFFATTGITDGSLLTGVQYQGARATSNSLILRGETRTRRIVHAEHLVDADRRLPPGS